MARLSWLPTVAVVATLAVGCWLGSLSHLTGAAASETTTTTTVAPSSTTTTAATQSTNTQTTAAADITTTNPTTSVSSSTTTTAPPPTTTNPTTSDSSSTTTTAPPPTTTNPTTSDSNSTTTTTVAPSSPTNNSTTTAASSIDKDECIRACALYFSPLCASNHQTYSNKCLFEIARCHQPSLTILYFEECRVVVVEKDNKEDDFCSRPVCAFEYKPVCGSNQQTYSNECHLRIAQCSKPSLTLAHRGRCVQPRPESKDDGKSDEKQE